MAQPPPSHSQLQHQHQQIHTTSGTALATVATQGMPTVSVAAAAAAVAISQGTASGLTTTNTLLTRMNNNFGQYYLRFLRHHSTRASPVTVSISLINAERVDNGMSSRKVRFPGSKMPGASLFKIHFKLTMSEPSVPSLREISALKHVSQESIAHKSDC